MQKSHKQKMSLRRAIGWIMISTMLCSGSAALGLFYFQYVKSLRSHDDKYRIIAIIQSCPQQEPLKTIYLAELLDLSIDQPTNLFQFSAKEAKKKLLASPLITEAEVVKISPGTVYVDYKLRQPMAFLLDYTNTVIDHEGVPFPFKPFFTPKKLPEIYLGLKSPIQNRQAKGFKWGISIQGRKMQLAMRLMDLISNKCCSDTSTLRRIDVSKAFASSYGQREIVVVMEDVIEREKEGGSIQQHYSRVLRLSTENYAQELSNYLVLRETLMRNHEELAKEGEAIIDLRVPHLAFIK